MPRIVLTDPQKELLKDKLGDDALATALIDMVDAGVNSNGVNNTTPVYVPSTDYYDNANGIYACNQSSSFLGRCNVPSAKAHQCLA